MDTKIIGRFFGFLVLAGSIGTIGYQVELRRPGSVLWQRAQVRARAQMADWARTPRSLAEVMLERYGPPDGAGPEALVWSGPYPWKRVIVHRSPAQSPLEHVVAYDVPPEKLEQVRALGHGISVDPWNAELSARGDRESLNYLSLNLADEIVNGMRTPEEAREFFTKTAVLSIAGRSSPYMEGPLFKPRPRPLGQWETPGPVW